MARRASSPSGGNGTGARSPRPRGLTEGLEVLGLVEASVIELPASIAQLVADVAAQIPAVQQRLQGFLEGSGQLHDGNYRLVVDGARLVQSGPPT